MAFFLALVFGLFISIIGIIIPGMLNMTIAKISVKENKHQALRFAFGAVVVVFFK
jgi:threonine/homoserine/homoserine lactone efflux protein